MSLVSENKDPFFIESKFRTLNHILPLISSDRIKLLKLLEFLKFLLHTENKTAIAAYSNFLISSFIKIIPGLNFRSTPIKFIDEIYINLELLPVLVIDKKSADNIQTLLSSLKTAKENLLAIIYGRKSLDLISNSAKSEGVKIPLVEKETLLKNLPVQFGRLNKLNITVYFDKGNDSKLKLKFNSVSDKNSSELQKAFIVSKFVIEKLFGVQSKSNLLINCYFDDNKNYDGNSLNAGLAVIFIFSLLKLLNYKDVYSFNDDVTITGDVDSEGSLLPVSETGLRIKAEASFFSEVRYFIVPLSQKEIVINYFREIETDYNLPAPKVIGVNNIADIFFDRRLINQKRVAVPVRISKKAWFHRRALAAVLFIVLSLIIFNLSYGPLDKNPVSAKLAGKILYIKNKNESKLAEINLNTDFIPLVYNTDMVSFGDINKDGRNEVIWIDEKPSLALSTVYCTDILMGDTLWKYDCVRELICIGDPIANKDFRAKYLKIIDADNDGRDEVYIIAFNAYFPSYLTKLNAVTGKEERFYLHDGHLQQILFVDINNDSIKEIVLTAINNSLTGSAVILLDPRNFQGYSPHTSRHEIYSMKTGGELKYVSLPQTALGKLMKHESFHSNPQSLELTNDGKNFRVAIAELAQTIDNQSLQPIFYINFDLSLNITSFSTGDYFEKLSEQLFQEGKLKYRLDQKYFEEKYKPGIRVWETGK